MKLNDEVRVAEALGFRTTVSFEVLFITKNANNLYYYYTPTIGDYVEWLSEKGMLTITKLETYTTVLVPHDNLGGACTVNKVFLIDALKDLMLEVLNSE